MPLDPHLDCRDVALATRRVLTRATGTGNALIAAEPAACLIACQRSHETRSQHASFNEHCRMCAEVTGETADACRQALADLRA
ncbi:hypothetical protein ACWCP6_18510 [Streptomyces sp. NPDC002004]